MPPLGLGLAVQLEVGGGDHGRVETRVAAAVLVSTQVLRSDR
jgi:hypothetical protein